MSKIKNMSHMAEEYPLGDSEYVCIFHSMPAPAAITSLLNAKFVDVNDAFCQETGYSRAELLGRTTLELEFFLQPEQRIQLLDAVQSKGIHSSEITFRVKSGETVPFLTSASLVEMAGTAYLLIVVQDLREQVELKKELQETAVKFRTLFENSRDAIGVSMAGIHAYVNPAYLDLFGYSDFEELKGKPLFDLIAPASRDQMHEIVRKRSQGLDAPTLYETRGLRKDGTEFDMEVRSSTYDLDGKRYTWGLMRDVTERKSTEKALLENESRFRRALEAAGAVPYYHDFATNTYIFIGDGIRQLTGYTAQEMTPTLFGSLQSEEHFLGEEASLTIQEAVEMMQSGKLPRWRSDSYITRRDGNRLWIADTSVPIFDKDKKATGSMGFLQDLTERKQAEDALRESEEKLRLFIEHAPVGLAMLDREMRYLTVSRRWKTDSHLGDQNLSGRSHYEVFPEIPTRWKEVHRRALEGETVQADEDKFVRTNGEVQWMRWKALPWYAADGSVGGIILFAEDITERKQAEEKLRDSEDKFKYIFDHSVVGIVIALPDGRITVNQAFAEMLGYSTDELNQEVWQRITHPDDLEQSEREVAQLLAGEKHSTRFIKRYIHKDGGIVWGDVGIAIRRDSDGKPIHLITSVLDITERKKAELKLQRSEEKYRSIVENSLEGIMAFDATWHISFINAQGEAIFGYEQGELLGRPIIDIILDEDHAQHAERRKRWENETQGIYEGCYKKKDGTRVWLRVSGWTVMDNGTFAGIYTMITDITERKQAEEALRASDEQMRQFADSTFEGIVFSDNGIIIDTNEQCARMFGYSRSEMIGMPIANTADETSRKTIANHIREELTEPYEVIGIRKDGTAFPAQVRGHNASYLGRKTRVTIIRDITESKLAEAALRASETQLKDAQQIAHIGSSYWDARTNQTAWSDEMYRITGWDPALPAPTREERAKLYTPESYAIFMDAVTRALSTGEPYDLELEIIRPDGILRQVHAQGTAVYDAEGAIIALQGTLQDITERKMADIALRASEENYRSLAENSESAIAVLDRDGYIRYANPAGKKIWNDPHIVGKHIFDIYPEEYARRYEAAIKQVIDTHVTIQDEVESPINGQSMWFRISMSPLKNPDGTVNTLVLNAWDMTQRKQAEDAIRHRNQMLLTLHNVALQVSSELQLSQLFTNVMGQAQSLLNSDRGGGVYLYEPDIQSLHLVQGTGINKERHGITVQIGKGIVGRVYQMGRPLVIDDYTHWEGHTTILVDEHDSPSTVMGVPLIVQNKVLGALTFVANSKFRKFTALDVQLAEMFAAQVAIAIQNAQLYRQAQDEIKERAKAQDELRSLNEKLEQRVAERTKELNHINIELEHANRAKDEFLANMSHELRSPLNSILGLSETLLEQRRSTLAEGQQRYVQTIESSARHLLALINDILDLSKIEAGKFDCYPETVLVDDVCYSSISFIKNQAVKKSVNVTYMNDEHISTISADPRRLKQILVNLLTNAVKFTPERGQVSLEVHAEPENNLIQLSVTDTGIGIDQTNLQKLFQPFVQVDNSLTRNYEGTGLGLALVQKLTDLHGGSVEVASTPGQGSCFTINLPWTPEPLQGNTNTPSTSSDLSTPNQLPITIANQNDNKQALVLLAEDNLANIMTIGEYLESYEYKVVVAHDGLETLAKAEEINPNLILMDIQMPALDGLEATRRLRANPRFAATPIIALTALAMPGDRERCLAAGANEYMSKPVKLKSLVKTIQDLLKS